MPKVSQISGELADREAIRDCLYRYSRGVDRCDEAMLRSAYWPDAVDNHLTFTGGREELIAWMLPLVRQMHQTMHMIGNVLIELNGHCANVEAYFHGFHRIPGVDGRCCDTVAGGRYLDRFERRDDEWRIAHRIVVTDWFREYVDSGDWEKGPFGMRVAAGGRWPEDVSYSLFKT